MVEKILLALIAGGGGGISLGLLPLLTKLINPQGKYSLAFLLSMVVFLLAGGVVVAMLIVSNPGARRNVNWVMGALIVSGLLAGILLPLGTFGFWLAFASIALGISVALHGISGDAVKGCFGGIAGLVAGGIAATVLGPSSEQFGGDLRSEIIAGSIAYGLIVFGITIGLLTSLEKNA